MHFAGELGYPDGMSATQPLRMPTTVAQRKGIGKLAAEARERTLILTVHGKPSVVVMSPSQYDAQRRKLIELEQKIIGTAAALVADRSTMLKTAEARERLLAAD